MSTVDSTTGPLAGLPFSPTPPTFPPLPKPAFGPALDAWIAEFFRIAAASGRLLQTTDGRLVDRIAADWVEIPIRDLGHFDLVLLNTFRLNVSSRRVRRMLYVSTLRETLPKVNMRVYRNWEDRRRDAQREWRGR